MSDVVFMLVWIVVGLLVSAVMVLAMIAGQGKRGYRPHQPMTGPPPCAVLSMESPLRADGYCADEPPASRHGRGRSRWDT